MWHRHSCLCRRSPRLSSQALNAIGSGRGHRQECLCHIGPGSCVDELHLKVTGVIKDVDRIHELFDLFETPDIRW
jgi:hypothetical protein